MSIAALKYVSTLIVDVRVPFALLAPHIRRHKIARLDGEPIKWFETDAALLITAPIQDRCRQ